MLKRRDFLWLAAAATSPVAAGRPAVRLAAAWERDGRFEVGILQLRGTALRRVEAIEVPTRAHGLLQQADGSIVAVARRPGDWMVRWKPGAARNAAWTWLEEGATLNGHACMSADGRRLFTTETEHESGMGRIAVRDAASLEQIAAWPTHGADPHELVLDAAGDLWIANGGIVTAPETGRAKLHLERMDSSLVRLDARSGELEGQWRLEDPRLGLRHLAWGRWEGRPALGIALQAEHTGEAERHAAPVLALWQDGRLRAQAGVSGLRGYGGDIAYSEGRFAVSCPRGDAVVLCEARAKPQVFPLVGACALAAEPLRSAGTREACSWSPGQQRASLDGLRIDNHWLPLR